MIDPPMIPLIRQLRNEGFNTVWCCAHGPRPFVAMDSYRSNEEALLEAFLKHHRYKNYNVSIVYYGARDKDMLTILFKTEKKEGELMNSEEMGGKEL
jgi:hypothetical protein